jgi:hypothetical protein
VKKYFSYLLLILFLIIGFSCSKDNMDSSTNTSYKKITEGYAIGAATKVELYANQELTTGYNELFITLLDSATKQPVEYAQITLRPMMDMGSMKHSSPVENPSTSATNKMFTSGVVFTMPSGSMGSWTIDVNILVGGRQGKLTAPLTIVEAPKSRLRSFVSKADNSKFIVALLQPEVSKVGVNEMEIAIYKAKNMMEFPADSSLTVVLSPEMPTMGHGSPNNVDPVHTTKGHYKGKVNFTMTGLWHLNLDFKAGNNIADTTTYFEVNF